MKKRILVNKLNKLLKENLKESSIKVGDKDYESRLRRRVTDLRRAESLAIEAAKKAREEGNEELAEKLDLKIEIIEELLKNLTIDTIDDEEEETDGSQKTPSEEESELDDSGNTESGEENPEEPENASEEEKTESEEEAQNTEDQEELSDVDSSETNSGETSKEETKDSSSSSSSSSEEEDSEEEKESDSPKEGSESEEELEDEEEDTDLEGENTSHQPEETSEEEDAESTEDGEEEAEKKSSKSQKGDGEGTAEEEEDSEDENEESDSEETETEDDSVEDPFADEEDIADLSQLSGNGMQEPREATLKDIIKQLSKLDPESKRGAIAALKDLISKRGSKQESLTEALKGLREMTDDEFGDFINSVYDLIDQVEQLEYEDEETLKNKKTKVGQWSTDPNTLKELENEMELDLSKDHQKTKAREKEKQNYVKVGSLEEFKINFYNAINNQVEMVRQEYQTYNEINAEYESEDVIMKADAIQEIPEEVKPIVDIYFDVSSSWEPDDIEIGKKAVATIKEFEDAGDVILNIFYFSNGVGTSFQGTRATWGQGTWGWREVLKNIKATEAQNIIVMTDNDIDTIVPPSHDAQHGPTLKVDGCVWFLWKNGLASTWCTKRLIGKQGSYQYAFYR